MPPHSGDLAPSPVDLDTLWTSVAEQIGVGVYTWDGGAHSWWSPTIYRMLGLPSTTPASPEAFFTAVHPDDRARAAAATQAVADRGPSGDQTFRLLRPDGTVRWVRSTVRRPADAGGRFIGTIQDITDETEGTQAAIAANQALLRAQRAGGIGTFEWDPVGGTAHWSQTLYELLGIEPIGARDPVQLWRELLHPDDRAAQRQWFKQLMVQGALPPFHLRTRRPDGQVSHLEIEATRSTSGIISGLVREVSVQRALQDQLRHVARMEAVGTLAAGVAHDFNNYLMIVSGALELTGDPDRPPSPSRMAAARHAVEKCAELTMQLLAFARRQPADTHTVELGETVTQAVALLQHLLGEPWRLTWRPPARSIYARVDPGHLETVLVNLIVNARDAMPLGGTVTIALDELPRGALGVPDVDSPGVEGWARLRVSDQGPGVPPALQERVFEPYFTTKPLGRGTGLGLATVWGTMQQHGGTVRLGDAEGGGASFDLLLPSRGPASVPVSAPSIPPKAPAVQGVVLLVEDVPQIRRVARSTLERHGHQVVEAKDGAAALAALAGGLDPDVIVTDLRMPGMDGVKLLGRLAAQRYPGRVVVMTGFADAAVEQLPSGVRIVRKPFTASQLLDALKNSTTLNPDP